MSPAPRHLSQVLQLQRRGSLGPLRPTSDAAVERRGRSVIVCFARRQGPANMIPQFRQS
jgi:hypothetical protein